VVNLLMLKKNQLPGGKQPWVCFPTYLWNTYGPATLHAHTNIRRNTHVFTNVKGQRLYENMSDVTVTMNTWYFTNEQKGTLQKWWNSTCLCQRPHCLRGMPARDLMFIEACLQLKKQTETNLGQHGKLTLQIFRCDCQLDMYDPLEHNTEEICL